MFQTIRYYFEVNRIPTEKQEGLSLVFSWQNFLREMTKKYLFKPFYEYQQLIIKNIEISHDLKSKKKRVIHIVSNIEIGGSQKIIFDIINGLQQKFTMELFILDKKVLFSASNRTFTSFQTIEKYIQMIKLSPPDVIHVHYFGDYDGMHHFLKKLLSKKIKSYIIENANNPIPVYFHPAINKYVFVSKYARRIQKSKFKKGAIIYPGFDLSIFHNSKLNKSMKSCSLHIGLVYRLTNDKIHKNTIHTLIKICQLSPMNWIFHIVGFGPNFFYYLKEIEKAKVRQHFYFHGYIPYKEMPAVYNLFDLFLAPVHSESFGVVVPYAMSANIPVIGYDVGALREILGPTGTLVSSEKALIAKTLSYTKDPQFFGKKEANARLRAEKMFELSKMVEKYKNIYEQTVSK